MKREEEELDSEEEDDDYRPEKDEHALEASDDDELQGDVESEDDCKSGKRKKGAKKPAKVGRPKKEAKPAKKTNFRRGGIYLSDDEDALAMPKLVKPAEKEEAKQEQEQQQEEQLPIADAAGDKRKAEEAAEEAAKKARLDALWADLNDDPPPKPRPAPAAPITTTTIPTSSSSSSSVAAKPAFSYGATSSAKSSSFEAMMAEDEPKPAKTDAELRAAAERALAIAAGDNRVQSTNSYTVVETLDFAGEQVTVTKQIDLDSREDIQRKKTAAHLAKRGTGTALDSLVAQVCGKKKVCNTLDKSSSDWESFKDKTQLHDELEQQRKGGYLEKVAFLGRTAARVDDFARNATGRRKPAGAADL